MDIVTRDHVNVQRTDKHYWVGELKEQHNLIYLRARTLCGWFDGVTTMLNYIQEYMPEPKREESSSDTHRPEFNSFGTYEEALDTYIHHPSKVRSFSEVDLALTDLESPGFAHEYDVTGDFLDIGRYLEGDPEAFGVMLDGNPRARRVNMVINLSWWAGVDKEVLNLRCERIQRLTDWLESKGVRTRIVCIESTECAHVEVMVKDHGEALDLNALAVVTHGDFLRRIIFRFDEYSPTWQWGYGSPQKFNNAMERLRPDNDSVNEFDVLIGNQVRSTQQVTEEFDGIERVLNRNIGQQILKPSDMHKTMFVGDEF